jgi:hypothetical protein
MPYQWQKFLASIGVLSLLLFKVASKIIFFLGLLELLLMLGSIN